MTTDLTAELTSFDQLKSGRFLFFQQIDELTLTRWSQEIDVKMMFRSEIFHSIVVILTVVRIDGTKVPKSELDLNWVILVISEGARDIRII